MNNEVKVTKEKNILHYILKVLELFITIAIIVISSIIIVQRISNNEKAFLGYRMFIVQTGSMTPKYNVGDVILVKEKDIAKIQVGDDVTYQGLTGDVKGKIVTHQVVRKEQIEGETVFYTKGIANKLEDKEAVTSEQINGTVIARLQIVTWITSLLSNKYIVYFLFILPLTIYIFFTVVSQKLKKMKKIERKTEENGTKKED